MSLDQIESVDIAPVPAIRLGLSAISTTAFSGGVSVATKGVGINHDGLILLQDGHKGLDLPDQVVQTRPVVSGVGDVIAVERPRSRRYSLRLSSKVASPAAYESLISAVSGPFVVKFNYESASGKSARVIPRCIYTGGLNRSRVAAGRSVFNLNFICEHPYLVASNSTTSGASFTPSTVRTGSVVWGVADPSSSGQSAQIRVKVGAPLTSSDPDAWVWQWQPPGETLSGGVFGSTNPRGVVVCFSPPFDGVFGGWAQDPLGGVDVSSGRVRGAQLPPLLPASPTSVHVSPGTWRVWYWQDFAGV